MNNDLEHLRLLSIFHYVVAGLSGLYSLFSLLYGAFGAAMVSGLVKDKAPEATWVGWIVLASSAAFLIVGIVFAVCVARAGQFLGRHTHYTFCLVIAAIECPFMPFGTVLGVFTITVLMRPSVKELFGQTGA